MAPVHLVIITTGINLLTHISSAMWRRLSQNSVKLFRIKKSKSSSCFPSQLSVNRAPRAAHICPGRTRPWRAEESRGRRDCELHRKTYFRPPSRPQHSSAQVKPASLSAVFFFLMFRITRASTVSVPLHPQLAVQGSHRQGRAGECRWRLSCCQGHHQHRCLRTLQETVRRQIAERDPSCCTSKKTTVTFTFVKCFKIFKVWFCKRMTYLLVNT